MTHGNLLNDMTAVSSHGGAALAREGDSHLSFLPLAHMFERLLMCNVLSHGGMVGFSRGNPLVLLDDIEELKPTTFAGVPRLYNRSEAATTTRTELRACDSQSNDDAPSVAHSPLLLLLSRALVSLLLSLLLSGRLYDKVLAMVDSGSPVKRWLFHRAYAAKLANLRATGSVQHALYDRLVFAKVAAKLGGRVRVMVTGSAPIADNVMQVSLLVFFLPPPLSFASASSACEPLCELRSSLSVSVRVCVCVCVCAVPPHLLQLRRRGR